MTVSRLEMSRVENFPPLIGGRPRVLILGSTPGTASLAAGQYYAHPRNDFWRLLEAILEVPLVELPYERRRRVLVRSRIALWDVLASCRRVGSLDSAVELAGARFSDVPALLRRHRSIERVCFNGALAEKVFRSMRGDGPLPEGLEYLRLPSSSPAHAGRSFAGKLAAWHAAIRPAAEMGPD